MRRRVSVLFAMALVAVVAVVVVPGSPAQADDNCKGYVLCSRITNHLPQGAYVAVAKRWCGTRTRLDQNGPPCAGEKVEYIASGDHTPSFSDYDTFRVERGCKVTAVDIYDFVETSSSYTITASGTTNTWIKVKDNQEVLVQARKC